MSLLTASTISEFGDDQASELRRRIAMRTGTDVPSKHQRQNRCRSLTVFSGKGGVGKSVIALNLAIELASQGAAVCLLDAVSGFGNLGLLCGENGYWNLSHVTAGMRSLQDILLTGPAQVQILPGAVHLLTETSTSVMHAIAEFECQFDWLIVDTGADIDQGSKPFVDAADCSLNIVTPEPTALAGAYAGLKSMAASSQRISSVLVNQAMSEQQATSVCDGLRRATRTFLSGDIGMAGFIPFDTAVCQSVADRRPLIQSNPTCAARMAIQRIAERLKRTVPAGESRSFVERLQKSISDRRTYDSARSTLGNVR